MILVVYEGSAAAQDPEGRWKVIDGDVKDVGDLAENVTLVYGPGLDRSYQSETFSGVGVPLKSPSIYDVYLEKGSLNIVVEAKSNEKIECILGLKDCEEEVVEPEATDCPEGESLIDDECIKPGNKLPDEDEDGIPDKKDPDDDNNGELDALPGCEVGDDLCDVISDVNGDEDEALGEGGYGEIIEGVLIGLEKEGIDLPLGFDYGQLAKLVGSGLSPRNVDAPGRSLALHNNLLVDASSTDSRCASSKNCWCRRGC